MYKKIGYMTSFIVDSEVKLLKKTSHRIFINRTIICSRDIKFRFVAGIFLSLTAFVIS